MVGRPKKRVPNPDKGKNLFLFSKGQVWPPPPPACFLIHTGAICPETRSCSLILCNAKFKNKWNHIFTSPHAVAPCLFVSLLFSSPPCLSNDHFTLGFLISVQDISCVSDSNHISRLAGSMYVSVMWIALAVSCLHISPRYGFPFNFFFRGFMRFPPAIPQQQFKTTYFPMYCSLFFLAFWTIHMKLMTLSCNTEIQTRSKRSADVAYCIIRIPK